jgi:hypothetical protein
VSPELLQPPRTATGFERLLWLYRGRVQRWGRT